MTTIRIKTGSEGPRHDPYAYREITVSRPKGSVTLHLGLVEWVAVNGEHWKDYDREAIDVFEAFAGITLPQAIRAHHEVRARRVRYHPCGQKHLEWVDGYPGESLLICERCGAVLDEHFDRSAIE